jgi:iron complex transport system permease protein
MKSRTAVFVILSVLLLLLAVADLCWGSIAIPLKDILAAFGKKESAGVLGEIVLNYRLPKVLTAIVAGSALSVSGLMMQTLFRTTSCSTGSTAISRCTSPGTDAQGT